MSSNAFRRSERVLNLSIIAAALACVGIWGYYFYRTSQPRGGTYQVGDSLAPVPEVNEILREAEQSMLLYVNSQCGVCKDSLPFYRRLLAEKQPTSGISVVGVSRETYDQLRDYLKTGDVAVDKLVTIAEASPFRQTLTPAIMLVGKTGEIEKMWLGRLSPEQETEVLALFQVDPSK